MIRTPPAGERYGMPEEVADRVRILALIQRIVSERLFVTVSIPGEPTRYNSTVLSVEVADGSCLLDSLYPENGDQRATGAGRIQVFAGFDGAALSFDTAVMGMAAVAGLPVLRIALPTQVRYAQRRARYRVQVGEALGIPLTFTDAKGGVTPGLLHDISGDGLSAILPVDAERPVAGDRLACELRMAGEAPLSFQLEIRDLRHRPDGKPVVGARFLSAEPMLTQRLERLVVELERQLLQRRP